MCVGGGGGGGGRGEETPVLNSVYTNLYFTFSTPFLLIAFSSQISFRYDIASDAWQTPTP